MRLTGHNEHDPGAAERRSGIASNDKAYESVWDYPRPPALDLVGWNIKVVHNGITIVDAPSAIRVLETSQPPAYYIDPQFIQMEHLTRTSSTSFCEWKGMASYASVDAAGVRAENACWSYSEPTPRFVEIAGHWAFYAQSVECSVDGEPVIPNPGSFYGGWMTAHITGPVKGAPGTLHW
ncbi:MAG: DUF427 domain-containing protein [Acidimicrobiales bacterium]